MCVLYCLCVFSRVYERKKEEKKMIILYVIEILTMVFCGFLAALTMMLKNQNECLRKEIAKTNESMKVLEFEMRNPQRYKIENVRTLYYPGNIVLTYIKEGKLQRVVIKRGSKAENFYASFDGKVLTLNEKRTGITREYFIEGEKATEL